MFNYMFGGENIENLMPKPADDEKGSSDTTVEEKVGPLIVVTTVADTTPTKLKRRSSECMSFLCTPSLLYPDLPTSEAWKDPRGPPLLLHAPGMIFGAFPPLSLTSLMWSTGWILGFPLDFPHFDFFFD
jgi:hypothetical protein